MERSIEHVGANRRFLLPTWLRWACLLSALFIAYSEFVSVAEDASTYRDVVAAILFTLAGSVGLCWAACAKSRQRSSNAQIYLLAGVGMTAPLAIELYQLTVRFIERAAANHMNSPQIYEPTNYSIHDDLELIGAFFFPLLAYFALMVILPIANGPVRRPDSNALESPRVKRFLLPTWLRWSALLLAAYVGYSQFVSAGLTGYFRYDPMERAFIDAGDPEIYDAVSFFEPPHYVAAMAVQGLLRYPFSPLRDLIAAIVLTSCGSIGLVLAGIMRAHWSYRRLWLVITSLLGVAAAFAIKIYEYSAGALGVAERSSRATDGLPPIDPIHPIYGYLELAGGLVVPLVAYSVVLLALLISACQDIVRWSIRRPAE